MAIEKTSTVSLHKSKGKVYFRTAIPFDIAVNVLGLRIDEQNKQTLKWGVKDKQVLISI